jgi:hypothetical protein
MSGSNSLLLDATPWQTLRHPPRDSAVSVYLRRSLDRLQARVFMQAPFVAPRIMAAVEHRHPGSRVNLWLGIGRRSATTSPADITSARTGSISPWGTSTSNHPVAPQQLTACQSVTPVCRRRPFVAVPPDASVLWRKGLSISCSVAIVFITT